MKRLSIIALVAVCASVSNAAEVVWNCFDENISCYQYGGSHGFWIDLGMDVSSNPRSDTVTLSANGDRFVLEFMGNWVAAVYGDIVCEETTRHLDSYFYHAYLDNSFSFGDSRITGTDDGPLESSGAMSATKGESAYLMFAVESTDILFGGGLEVYYGWVQLEIGADGSVTVGASAIDLSGGPMIVGGGSASTPEPSGALLALAGGAALVLRRRGRMDASGGRRDGKPPSVATRRR